MEFLLSNQSQANATINHTDLQLDASTGDSEKLRDIDTFKLILETVIAFVGVVGNIAVCAVVTHNKKKRSSTEYLLRNLAIADLGVLLVNFPLAVVKEKIPFNWPFGRSVCLYLYPTTETFYGVSVWTIVGIAIERYRYLFNPIKKGRKKAVKNAKRLAIALWIGSFLIFGAPTFYWIDYFERNQLKVCQLKFRNPKVMEGYILILFLLWYVTPVGLILWTYIAISRQLHQSNIFLKTMHRSDSLSPEMLAGGRTPRYSGTQERRLQQNKRVKKILTPVVVAFIITMMPVNIFRVVILYYPSVVHSPIYPLAIYLFALCVVINSSINPLIYCFVSRGFRAGLFAVIKRRSVGFSMLGSGVRSLKERISMKVRRSRMFSFHDEPDFELRQAVKNDSPAIQGKCEPGSQQTLPD